MIDDLDLIEQDERIEHIERAVVDHSCQDDVFEELEAIGLRNLSLDSLIFEFECPLVLCGVLEEIPI